MNSDTQLLDTFLEIYPALNISEVSYDVFRVKNRIIYNPSSKLKRAQRIIKRNINKYYPLKSLTINCAKIHSDKKWVLKMDIKDFYGSVKLEYIRRIISSVFYQEQALIDYLTDMVTVGNKLPTGAPTSAHIANACFLPIDKRIKEYCDRYEVAYSRYMDDMTFSSDNKNVLNSVEYYITDIIQTFGLKINEKKTRYISSNKQQNILGIVVNKEVRIPKKLRKKVRAMIHHYAITKGNYAPINTNYPQFKEEDEAKLQGYMNYIKSVDEKTYNKLVNYSKSFRVKTI